MIPEGQGKNTHSHPLSNAEQLIMVITREASLLSLAAILEGRACQPGGS